MCCVPAPPVIELSPDGTVLRSWGGPGEGFEWPESEHGIHVDQHGHVWIGGNGASDAHVLKFTSDGEFLLQIGRAGQSGGSNDTDDLGRAAGIEVDVAANEVYIADGYGNRRVIVYDAETGEYKRHWGAAMAAARTLDAIHAKRNRNDGRPDTSMSPPLRWRFPVIMSLAESAPACATSLLQRDVPVELGVSRSIHLPHATLADEGGDVVMAEAGADVQRHGCGRAPTPAVPATVPGSSLRWSI